MSDNEAILEKVRELLDNTLKELIEIKDTLFVLRSSETYIAENGYTFTGADTIEMIVKSLQLCIKEFKRLSKKTLILSELNQYPKVIDSIFYRRHYTLTRLLELYIIYTQTNLCKVQLQSEGPSIEEKEVLKGNGNIALKLYKKILDISQETGRIFSRLLPIELKSDAA